MTATDSHDNTSSVSVNIEVIASSPANTAPTAAFTVTPASGTTDTQFSFDASACSDAEDAVSVLQVRWDWESDGVWDTEYSTNKIETHQYSSEGTKTIKLEVKDTGGLTNTTTNQISVDNSEYITGDWEWARTFGSDEVDRGSSVQQTQDGGFVLTGYTESFGSGGKDVWIIKTDQNGIEEWDKKFGGEKDEEGYSIQQTQDGGFVLTGYTESFGSGGKDVWIIKTDQNGNEEWNRTFGGSDADVAESVIEAQDGGYIIAGWTASYNINNLIAEIWIIKVNSNGDEEWEKTYFYNDNHGYAYSVIQIQDGSYVTTGTTWSGNGYCIFLLKIDEYGNQVWMNTFGQQRGDGYEVIQTDDGGFIIVGEKEISIVNSYSDIWIIKTNSDGNEIWNKTYGYGGSESDVGYSIDPTFDGGYILTGRSDSYGSNNKNIFLLKIDNFGNEEWKKIFDGFTGCSVKQTYDGKYIVTGFINPYGPPRDDILLFKY